MNEVLDLLLPVDLEKKITNSSRKFIITGANGWIGKALLEVLYNCYGDKIEEYVFPISTSAKKIILRNGHQITAYDYDYDFNLDGNYTICHFAFLTKDKVTSNNHQEYIKANDEIKLNVSRIIENVKPKSIIYSSSGAVYNKSDIYGISKLKDEEYFINLAKNINADIVVPRIFNIAGPYINKQNLYAISDFINQAMNKGVININANCLVYRSYIYILDLFKICFSWLYDENEQENVKIFDTANELAVELSELAEIVVKLINKPVVIVRDNYDENLEKNYYVGNADIQKELCRKYDIDLLNHEQIVENTIKYLSTN